MEQEQKPSSQRNEKVRQTVSVCVETVVSIVLVDTVAVVVTGGAVIL